MGHTDAVDATDNRQVYHREIDIRQRDSLSQIAARLPRGANVLDVGTGSGALGRYLTAVGGIADGVTYATREMELAKPYYRDLQCADIEQVGLDQLFVGRQYDAIVFADVLEHVRDPERTLKQAQNLLIPKGKILISIPNVGYIGVVAGLMAGSFRYTDEGLLDRTHVRFFTRMSLLEMLTSVGLRATHVDAVLQPLARSEFAHLNPYALAPSVQRALLSNADALVYQFVVEAQREGEVETSPTMVVLPKPELTFVAKVYWSGAKQAFSEEATVTSTAKIGEEQQVLRFELPPSTLISTLRLDPADRPGLLRLHSISWCDGSGSRRWSWEGEADVLQPGQTTFLTPAERGSWIAMLDDDPSIELAVGPMTTGGGDYIECVVDWPTSPDALGLKAQFDAWLREKQSLLAAQCAELTRKVEAAAELDMHQVREHAEQMLEKRANAHAMELRLISALVVRLEAVARLHHEDLAGLNEALQSERTRNCQLAKEVSTLHQRLASLAADLASTTKKCDGLERVLDQSGVMRIGNESSKAGHGRLRKIWRK